MRVIACQISGYLGAVFLQNLQHAVHIAADAEGHDARRARCFAHGQSPFLQAESTTREGLYAFQNAKSRGINMTVQGCIRARPGMSF